jgi:hypothetical protein
MKFLFILILLSAVSCKSGNQNSEVPNSTLYNDVMDIHDNVMPELATIHRLKRDIKAMSTPETHGMILHQIKELDKADEAMMAWMAEFKVPSGQVDSEVYLQSEKIKITNVSDAMFKSISDTRMLMDSLSGIKK